MLDQLFKDEYLRDDLLAGPMGPHLECWPRGSWNSATATRNRGRLSGQRHRWVFGLPSAISLRQTRARQRSRNTSPITGGLRKAGCPMAPSESVACRHCWHQRASSASGHSLTR